jgi:sec-independent protein translocase protein TatB
MLDVGWPELLVIAIVLVVVVGPKDLPRMLRTFGRSTAKLRSMANDFRRQFDEALKEAELDDVKSVIDSTRKLDPTAEIRKQLNPINKIGDEIKSSLSNAAKTPEKPATSESAVAATKPLEKSTASAGNGAASTSSPKSKTARARTSASVKKPSGTKKTASKASPRKSKTEKQA